MLMIVREARDEKLDLDRLYVKMQSQHQEMAQVRFKLPEIQAGSFYLR